MLTNSEKAYPITSKSTQHTLRQVGCFIGFRISESLLGICNTASLADDSNLDLTGIGHLVLNLGCNLSAQCLGLCIVHLVGTDDDAQFATCLNGIGLRYAWIAHSDGFKIVQTLDISLNDFTTGTRTGTRDSVTNLYDGSQQGLHLHFVVVGTDGVADIGLSLYFSAILAP